MYPKKTLEMEIEKNRCVEIISAEMAMIKTKSGLNPDIPAGYHIKYKRAVIMLGGDLDDLIFVLDYDGKGYPIYVFRSIGERRSIERMMDAHARSAK